MKKELLNKEKKPLRILFITQFRFVYLFKRLNGSLDVFLYKLSCSRKCDVITGLFHFTLFKYFLFVRYLQK